MPHSELLAQLMPPQSYNTQGQKIAASLNAEGAELDRILADSAIALGALQPFTYQQWLEDWERVYGLPAHCFREGQLLQERLQLLALAFAERGGISIDWLKRYASLAGYIVTITEYHPFRAGHSCAGDSLSNGDWQYAFKVEAKGQPVRVFSAGQSVAGEALRTWGDPILECIINTYKPAHTVALVSYLNSQEQTCTA